MIVKLVIRLFDMLVIQVIVERAGREDAGRYECWDTKGEARSKTKQV